MKKQYEDDDGRTVADMSGLAPGYYRERFGVSRKKREERKESRIPSEPSEAEIMPKEDRRMYLFGAMGATLVIGLIFLGAAAVVIGLMVWLW